MNANVRDKGNVKDKETNADTYFEEYGPEGSNLIYQAEEAPIDGITAEDLEETLQDTKETAAGLDQWAPADLKMWSKEALVQLAKLMNLIEKSGRWPKQMKSARAAFLPKEEEDPLEPQSYRVLLMLPAVYRLWAKTRLRHIAPWVDDWRTEEMFAGVPGRGAADASYHTALVIENCLLKGEEFTGGAADIYKCFDQIDRTLLYRILEEAGLPKRILKAYKDFLEGLEVYNTVAGGLG